MAEKNGSTEVGAVNKIRAQRGKITLTDIKGMAGAVSLANGPVVIGYLSGKAMSFIKRKNLKTDEDMEGISGNFVGMSAFPEAEDIESGILFLPDAFHNIIASELRASQAKEPDSVLSFALEITMIPAKNPAGYSWQLKPASPPKGTHILHEEIALVENLRKKQLALAAPKK